MMNKEMTPMDKVHCLRVYAGEARPNLWRNFEAWEDELREILLKTVDPKKTINHLDIDIDTATVMGHRIRDLLILAEAYKHDGRIIESYAAAIKTGADLALKDYYAAMNRVIKQQMQSIVQPLQGNGGGGGSSGAYPIGGSGRSEFSTIQYNPKSEEDADT